MTAICISHFFSISSSTFHCILMASSSSCHSWCVGLTYWSTAGSHLQRLIGNQGSASHTLMGGCGHRRIYDDNSVYFSSQDRAERMLIEGFGASLGIVSRFFKTEHGLQQDNNCCNKYQYDQNVITEADGIIQMF